MKTYKNDNNIARLEELLKKEKNINNIVFLWHQIKNLQEKKVYGNEIK